MDQGKEFIVTIELEGCPEGTFYDHLDESMKKMFFRRDAPANNNNTTVRLPRGTYYTDLYDDQSSERDWMNILMRAQAYASLAWGGRFKILVAQATNWNLTLMPATVEHERLVRKAVDATHRTKTGGYRTEGEATQQGHNTTWELPHWSIPKDDPQKSGLTCAGPVERTLPST
jgi:hypothetical protein